MEKIRKHIFFSGIVQGVGFRYRAYHIAQMLGLTGWVRNTWDDRVEMEVKGEVSSSPLFMPHAAFFNPPPPSYPPHILRKNTEYF